MTPIKRLNACFFDPDPVTNWAGRCVSARGLWVWLLVLCLCGMGTPGRTDVFTVLYNFTGGADQGEPYAGLIQARDGNLYGTTYGLRGGNGTVFQVTTGGALTTLYSFTGGADGADPVGALIQAKDGNLYGTTVYGGANRYGTVFKISVDPMTGVFDTGSPLTTLYSFTGEADGWGPYAALVQAKDGALYGTTYWGGANNVGTVFRITTDGASFTTLYTFSQLEGGLTNTDGAYPQGALIQATDGNLYGTTYWGGANYGGTIFRITTSGAFTPLYSFTGGADGANPEAGLIQAKDGNLYGTTGGGTVFKMTTGGAFTPLYSITGASNSARSSLFQAKDGNLYGTAGGGNADNNGTVFKITTSGKFTNLYDLNPDFADGDIPWALIQASDGSFYGTTYLGGAYSFGTIYSFKIVAPTITSLSPASVQADTAFTLTVSGTAIVPNAVVEWNGKALQTTYLGGGQLSAIVTTAVNKPLAAYPGSAKISVVNPDNSGSALLTITVPTPVLQKLTPATLPHGSQASTLTLTGTAFAPGAVVNWNNTTLTTTFVSPGKLTATIPASDLAAKGPAQVSVTNPSGGGTSQTLTFTIK